MFRSAVAAAPGDATFYFRPRVPAMSSLDPEPPEQDRAAVIEAALREPPAQLRAGRIQRMPRFVRRAVMHGLAWWTSAAEAVPLPCPVTTVSAVLAEQGIDQLDYLKIDVEGAEFDVLCGVDATDWPKIRQVAVETHDVDGRLSKVRALLERAGLITKAAQHWPFEGTGVYMVHGVRG
jgi:FkbM family methyltransferase